MAWPKHGAVNAHHAAVPAVAVAAAAAVPQAVYTALKETEQRATDLLPLWRVSPHTITLSLPPCYCYIASYCETHPSLYPMLFCFFRKIGGINKQ